VGLEDPDDLIADFEQALKEGDRQKVRNAGTENTA
jgi:hypothetical protein